jgi:hypothetical protein
MSNTESPDDILWGVAEIAKAIRRTDRQTYHLLSREYLPAHKVGAAWVASRRKLLATLMGEGAA